MSDRALTTAQWLLISSIVGFVPAIWYLGELGVYVILMMLAIGVPLRLIEDGRVIH